MRSLTTNLLCTLPSVIERYELKYVIPYDLVEPISDFFAPYCAFDQHSMAHSDRFYPVNSLYFDSPSYRFLKLRMWGAERRFNMRVRSYGDGLEGPYFAEIKFKTPTCVKKFRATLQADEWPLFLRQDCYSGRNPHHASKEEASRDLFLQLAESYAIEPKIFACYRRRAFVSVLDDYARVTFDIDMRYRPQDLMCSRDQFSLSPNSDCIHYDAQTVYDEEVRYNENVVLELKTTAGSIPVWMMEIIRRFELKQVGFSKYLNSTLIEHSDNGWFYMGGDRTNDAAAYS